MSIVRFLNSAKDERVAVIFLFALSPQYLHVTKLNGNSFPSRLMRRMSLDHDLLGQSENLKLIGEHKKKSILSASVPWII